MSLVETIKFRLSWSQLSQEESSRAMELLPRDALHSFIAVLLQSSSSFVVRFAAVPASIRTKFNDAISTVLTERNEAEPAQLRLDTFPKVIIGAIGSYLSMDEYPKFMRLNRRCYLGLTAPITLTGTLTLDDDDRDFSGLHGHSFPFVTKLEFNLQKSSELSPLAVSMPRLQSVDIDGGNSNSADVQHFVQSAAISSSSSSVTSLRLAYFSDAINHASLLQLFRAFKNVQSLVLEDFAFAAVPYGVNTFRGLFPKLTKLYLCSKHISDHETNRAHWKLIEAYSKQLSCLALTVDQGIVDNVDEVELDNLHEFQIFWPGLGDMRNLLERANSLRRIGIFGVDDCFQCIPLCVRLKDLRYLRLSAEDDGNDVDRTSQILRGIKAGLLDTKSVERDQLTVHVSGQLCEYEDAAQFIEELADIINLLISIDAINDFRFIWESLDRAAALEQHGENGKEENIITELEERMIGGGDVEIFSEEKHQIVITNRNKCAVFEAVPFQITEGFRW
eukprot:CAMPEP_0197042608 /NCGR_PEP_ID=MMETSP1384-20130603/18945_1 /TAXON_ID=29189 /ORGANISM="Ammonia sp." /LENGTH=504 /DNA_ID=CAMNT_0042473753 /DNA_START=142 /DNA_END=1653 /DNA_ORIENTATION=-